LGHCPSLSWLGCWAHSRLSRRPRTDCPRMNHAFPRRTS
jgi:hypothetical protein